MNIQQIYKPIFTVSIANRTLQLTREGTGFIFLSFAVGLGAINTGNNLLYLILAMCCSFIALSGTLSEITLKDLRVEAETHKELYAEDAYPITLKITNQKKLFPSFSLHFEIPSDPDYNFDNDSSTYVFHISPGKTVEKNLMFSPMKRGRLKINACNIVTSFPFGFFVKIKSTPIELQTIVYPPIRPCRIPIPAESSLEGTEGIKQVGDELNSLREFRPGDPISSVHWKASAKAGSLRVKEFSGSGKKSFSIFLNVLDPGSDNFISPELLDKRVVESASLVYHLIRRGHEVKLKTHDFDTDYGNSEAHLAHIMRYLALIGTAPTSSVKQGETGTRVTA
ncbi:MAG: DUF58 domain-containing protein [Nitrospinae bacterium]|nr:DUF58 domain-containing protein [Nitrospinota bacterium]